MKKKLWPVLIIGMGLVFLLYNLKIVSFSPWSFLWPIILMLLAVNQLWDLARQERKADDLWELVVWIVVFVLSVNAFLPRIGITLINVPWKILWPVLLILWGVCAIFSENARIMKIDFGKKDDNSK